VALRFGTDGVRGLANVELTVDLAMALGRSAARVLGGPQLLVGRDPRRSGPMLEAAFSAGVAAEGVDVVLLGVLPTPGLAHECQVRSLPGAVISASHNPFEDNGIKLFARGGRKLTDTSEQAVEAELEAILAAAHSPASIRGQVGSVVGAAVGSIERAEHPRAGYEAALVAVTAGRHLAGLRVVVDTANGAGSVIAPRVLRALGAEVVVINDRPDGCNINDRCGATHTTALQTEVVSNGAHLGIALDGDADRLIAVDHTGAVVDGDHILAICALDLRERGLLVRDTVVVTVMSNLGFRLAMESNGITVVETAVGDRYVLDALDAGGYSLGGEQSGHVIFADLATTGDGVLAAIVLADVVRRTGRTLADLASVMTRLPQVLVNVRVARRDPGMIEAIAPLVAEVERELAGRGRVLVRPSGTEPLVRVMVEAPTAALADAAARRLAAALGAL
jgi:phosphoglucosamine mutase